MTAAGVLMDGVREILQIKFAAPIGHARSVVICIAEVVGRFGIRTIGTHDLKVRSADRMVQTAVMLRHPRKFVAGVIRRSPFHKKQISFVGLFVLSLLYMTMNENANAFFA